MKEAAPAREMENIKANLSGSDELILLVTGELASTPLTFIIIEMITSVIMKIQKYISLER